MTEGPVVLPRRRRWRRRQLVGGAVTLLVAALLVGYVFVANVYMPLTQGSSAGPDSLAAGSLFVRSVQDPFGRGTMWEYCGVANARFAWFVSLRNDGPFPVTVLGGDPGPAKDRAGDAWAGLALIELAAGRIPTPRDTPLMTHEISDPRTAPLLAPTTIAPDDELEVWARFDAGNAPVEGLEWTQSLWIRYAVLGIDRTAEVALRDGIGITDACATPSPTGP